MARKAKAPTARTVETLRHRRDEATRKNIPTAEYQSVLEKETQDPVRVAYERRNRDLDPQLVWRGKDEQDWSDLVVHAPPLYIQEKVHPKALIDDLLRQTRESRNDAGETTPDLFADFNGLPQGADKTDFYQPDQNWSNRMILGDFAAGDGEPGRARGLARQGPVHLRRPAVRDQVQLELPVEHDQPRREGRQRGAHHARARAGEGVPRHVAGRDSFLPDVSARPADGCAGSADGVRVDLRADRR